MGQLAIAMSERGFDVSGSDREFYEPMSSLLKKSGIKTYEGYRADNIRKDADIVIIGNSVGYTNPEVAVVEEYKLPYTLFSKALAELIIDGRHSIVVTGTHGKTTTTALGASVLTRLGAHPSYFIGGQALGLEKSLVRGEGNFSIVEGDEYDSAFFAKTPKFHFYLPNTVIITSIEFDHADIYSSLDQIKAEFTKLLQNLPQGSHVVGCIDNPNVEEVISGVIRSRGDLKVTTYGSKSGADLYIKDRTLLNKGSQEIVIEDKKGKSYTIDFPMLGGYNALNAVAILAALLPFGFKEHDLIAAFSEFKGTKRRQEVIFNRDGITVIEDFAHHPTAVSETLSGIAERYPSGRLIAVFEPRSNSSRRLVFKDAYSQAFSNAAKVILMEVARRESDKDLQLLSSAELASNIEEKGVPAQSFDSVDTILGVLMKDAKPGDVIVLMSNGSFGGLPQRLTQALDQATSSQ
jgi:UDP-N-acetylmuramate: L-alanyl-gamma-D-glutamyl-meso-diaminopimelate ligase